VVATSHSKMKDNVIWLHYDDNEEWQYSVEPSANSANAIYFVFTWPLEPNNASLYLGLRHILEVPGTISNLF
jgi:hypothetical protein